MKQVARGAKGASKRTAPKLPGANAKPRARMGATKEKSASRPAKRVSPSRSSRVDWKRSPKATGKETIFHFGATNALQYDAEVATKLWTDAAKSDFIERFWGFSPPGSAYTANLKFVSDGGTDDWYKGELGYGKVRHFGDFPIGDLGGNALSLRLYSNVDARCQVRFLAAARTFGSQLRVGSMASLPAGTFTPLDPEVGSQLALNLYLPTRYWSDGTVISQRVYRSLHRENTWSLVAEKGAASEGFSFHDPYSDARDPTSPGPWSWVSVGHTNNSGAAEDLMFVVTLKAR